MRNHLVGFLVSVSLHAGVFLLANSLSQQPPKKALPKPIPLNLAMFKSMTKNPKPVPEKPKPAPVPVKEELVVKPKTDVVKRIKPPITPPKPVKKKLKPKPTKKIIKKKRVKKKTIKKRIVKRALKPKQVPRKKVITRQVVKRTPMRRQVPATRVQPARKPVQVHRQFAKQQKPVRQAAPSRRVVRQVVRKPIVQRVALKKRPVPGVVKPRQRQTPVQNVGAERAFKARLHQLIATNKRYPKRAKRMGKQGTVRVSFIILSNGQIRNVRVIQSSGNSSLDKAAIKAVNKSSGRLPFPKGVNKRQWAMTVPITYKLR